MTRKEELLEFGPDEPEMLYAILSKLPKLLDLESLISRAISLYSQHPPETLPFRAWRKVSSYSVLKSTSNAAKLQQQTLADGEDWLQKQSVENERAEARKKLLQRTKFVARKYQRPAGAVTVAIIVAVLSIWLGRNGSVLPAAGAMGLFGVAKQRIIQIFGHAV